MMGSIFWSSFFILIGLSIALKAIFGIDIPVIKLFIAVFFIYIGLTILWGPSFFRSTIRVAARDDGDYIIMFGKQSIDLTSLSEEHPREVQAVVVFASSTIKINPSVPTKIIFKGAFSSVRLPESYDDNALMGKVVYTTKNFDKEKKYLCIEITSVFANVKVVSA